MEVVGVVEARAIVQVPSPTSIQEVTASISTAERIQAVIFQLIEDKVHIIKME